jgi:hypothetical protein
MVMDLEETICSVEENMSSLQKCKNIGVQTFFRVCWLGVRPLEFRVV